MTSSDQNIVAPPTSESGLSDFNPVVEPLSEDEDLESVASTVEGTQTVEAIAPSQEQNQQIAETSSPTMTSIFFKSILTETIRLDCTEMNNKFRQTIADKVKMRLEGRCSRHGYIKDDSVEVLSIAPGIVRKFSLNGDASFDVQIRAEVCNPAIGSIVAGQVVKTNRYGVLASIYIKGSPRKVMDVFISKQSSFKSIVDLSALEQGSNIAIEIVGKKLSMNDDRICAIGRVVSMLDQNGADLPDVNVASTDAGDEPIATEDDETSVADDGEVSDQDEQNEDDDEVDHQDELAEEDEHEADDGEDGVLEENDEAESFRVLSDDDADDYLDESDILGEDVASDEQDV